MEAWVGEALAGVGGHLVLPADKEAFLGHVHEYVSSLSPNEPPPPTPPSFHSPTFLFILSIPFQIMTKI